MNKNVKKLLIVCISILALTAGAVYAAKVYEISFTNTVESRSVDIKIEQFEKTKDGEQLASTKAVMPNEKVSYIPRVTNLRADGYVRVKAEIVMDKEVPKPIVLDYIYGQNEEWVRVGDYFYLTRVLKHGETSDIFEGFNIPAEWTQDAASGFNIKLTADVVQEAFFEPDFSSIAPWGTLEIEEAKEEDNVVYGIAKETTVSPVWEYTSAKGLESKSSDLFKNFNDYMAGDTYKDSLEMKNSSRNDIYVYFKTSTIPSDLIDQMKLKIVCDGNVVYEGALNSSSLNEYKKLTTIKKNSSQNFEFEVYLPVESKNYYSVLEDDVLWQFKVEEIKEVKTGDDFNAMPFVAVGIIALAVILSIIATRKRGRNNEEE